MSDPVMDDTFAEKLFAIQNAYCKHKDALYEHVIKASGADWDELHLTCDDYDNSMELKGAKNDFVPSLELHDAILDLGFTHYWVCFRDGSEIHNGSGPTNQDQFNRRRCKKLSAEAKQHATTNEMFDAFHSCNGPFDAQGNHEHEFCCGYTGDVA